MNKFSFRQTLLHTMNPKPTILNISVEEIIKIHNILLEVKESLREEMEENNSNMTDRSLQQRNNVKMDSPLFNLLDQLEKVPNANNSERKLR